MYLIWNREKVCMHPKKVRWEGKGGCTGGGVWVGCFRNVKLILSPLSISA